MSAKTAKLITPDRVKMIFECYGSNPDCWPVDEKASALSLIQHSSELRELQKEFADFDRLLMASDMSAALTGTTDKALLNRIVEVLPEQESRPNPAYINREAGKKKHFLDFNSSIGAIAASVAIVAITLSIVNLRPEHAKPVSPVVATTAASSADLDSWMWEQVLGEPSDEAEEPLTMMTLLELGEI